MSIRFACPACNAVIKAPADKVGRKVNCPKCGQRLQIPPPPKERTVVAKPLPAKEPGHTPAAPPPPPVPWPAPTKSVNDKPAGDSSYRRWPIRLAVLCLAMPLVSGVASLFCFELMRLDGRERGFNADGSTRASTLTVIALCLTGGLFLVQWSLVISSWVCWAYGNLASRIMTGIATVLGVLLVSAVVRQWLIRRKETPGRGWLPGGPTTMPFRGWPPPNLIKT